MAEKLDPKDLVTIEELAISSMWEIAAIVEVLERKGLITKQELPEMIQELRHQQPAAAVPKDMFPEPYLLTEIENQLLDQILKLFNTNGLTSHQAKTLRNRLTGLVGIVSLADLTVRSGGGVAREALRGVSQPAKPEGGGYNG